MSLMMYIYKHTHATPTRLRPIRMLMLQCTWSLLRNALIFLGGVNIGSSLVNSSSKLLMSVLLF